MTIESYPLSNTELAASFEKLKREARSTADIQAWFSNNQQIFIESVQGCINSFNVVVHDRMDSNYVILGYEDRNRINEVFNADEPDTCVNIGITAFIETPPKPRHPFLDVLSAQSASDKSRKVMETWTLPIVVSEWSLLVGLAASHYMQHKIWDRLGVRDPIQNNVLAHYLEEHLASHFPGMTTEKLKMLHDSGLLDQVDDKSMLNFLFNTRNAAEVSMSALSDFSLGFDA